MPEKKNESEEEIGPFWEEIEALGENGPFSGVHTETTFQNLINKPPAKDFYNDLGLVADE